MSVSDVPRHKCQRCPETPQEICAIQLLASTERALASDGPDDSDSDIVDQLLAKYWSQRQQAEELAALLDDVVDRLPTAPVNPAKRFVMRKALSRRTGVERNGRSVFGGSESCEFTKARRDELG